MTYVPVKVPYTVFKWAPPQLDEHQEKDLVANIKLKGIDCMVHEFKAELNEQEKAYNKARGEEAVKNWKDKRKPFKWNLKSIGIILLAIYIAVGAFIVGFFQTRIWLYLLSVIVAFTAVSFLLTMSEKLLAIGRYKSWLKSIVAKNLPVGRQN
jgi:uncharacterized membrane protein YkgB